MRRANMKKVMFSLVIVVALIVMMLPADIAVARGHRGHDPTATNETQTTDTQTVDDELGSIISLAGLVAPPSGWPTEWIGLATDPNEGGGKDHRDVFDTNDDGYALYYYVDSDYIYLRMETVDTPGWPSTSQSDEARYKWWFNTDGTPAYIHGTTVESAEFLLILEDLMDNSDPNAPKDLLGELTLMDDLNNDGFMKRWDSSNPPNYTINNAQTAPTGPSSLWRRVLGDGTPGAGGPQGVMGDDIGYRIDNATTGGNFVDMYVSRAALNNPSSICLIWATDNLDPNLDQAPNLDRPATENCIMLGKDYGDAPDPTYPTLMANDGARHTISELYLGASIDAELDGIPNSTATGDDNDNIDDEDGVVFTASLVRGESADVTVTASAAGYLDAWLDFNDNGDWADAGEQIFTSEALSAGPNGLTFDVPFSAQAGDTFARFRFSSAGGLSYNGPADDGEVEDYMVAIEGCTLTVDLTGDADFCEGSDTTITAVVTDGTAPYDYDWSASTAPGTANDGTYTATGSGTVEVTVTDDNGCTGSDSMEVTALQGPTADFTADVTDCCEPLEVQFTDLSTAGDNPIVSWYWEFGDGDTSTDENPSHSYDAGTYTVSLTVTDSHGCSDTESKENYITSNEGPTADFTADPTSGDAPLMVQFTDLSTAGDNPIVSWYWEFGDGDTSTAENPSHTYNSVGTYTVTLTVTDEHGCTDDATGSITVTIPPPPPTPAGGCPTFRYLTVDWEGNNSTELLYRNDKLAKDLLGPSSDLSHNLFLERGTHAPVVFTATHYVIVVRELEEIPALPEDTEAIVVFNITPANAEFNKDIFLTLGVDELPANALNVTMAYYDDINGVWVLMDSEAGGPSGVAELTLSAPINHFSIYGVLAKFEPTTPQQPAHFVASGLNIEPTVEKLSVFVTRTGETVTITANVANDGGQGDTYTVDLKLNGETVDTKTVTLGAGQSKQVSFTVSELDYGQYEVEVAGLSGEFTTSRTITWWLILIIIIAVGLIIWGVVWGTRRRRKAQQEA
jgi:PKD repeat protein